MANVEAIVQSARRLQHEIDKLGFGLPSPAKFVVPKREDLLALYDILVTSSPLRDATRKLFLDGYYARAVEEAYKCLNNVVKDKSGLPIDGKDLMNQAFSEKNPILKLNELKTTSERDEQIGYMLIFGGCMTGIRNPRAHDHKKVDSPETALEMLAWANHLMGIVNKAKRTKRHRKPLGV
jgi:uncharacterized protein (TIGR02391 family)